jgi:hypothetical protein
MAPQRDGFPRICKYVRQLNEIAEAKERKMVPELERRLAALAYEYGMAQDSDDPKILDPIKAEMIAIESRLSKLVPIN